MPRKSKLEQMTVTDGKIDSINFKPTTLEQILGQSGIMKYNTMDENQYIARLNSMHKADLQTHASQLGVVPIDDRERLTKRLLTEFRQYVAQFRHPITPKQPDIKMTPELEKILAIGK